MYVPWCNLTFHNILHVFLYIDLNTDDFFFFVQSSTAGFLNVTEMSYLFVHQQVVLIPCFRVCVCVFACFFFFFFYQYGVSLCPANHTAAHCLSRYFCHARVKGALLCKLNFSHT